MSELSATEVATLAELADTLDVVIDLAGLPDYAKRAFTACREAAERFIPDDLPAEVDAMRERLDRESFAARAADLEVSQLRCELESDPDMDPVGHLLDRLARVYCELYERGK